ncbi:DUF3306 domain-containing protein [Boseongicola aestuarii]|uniref:DUF3306 domain-containing protein n=1 Tax=Boseongicola aestuarii TaxID=1470561 RepID=A0A238IZX7_9RHOB|nr:DUF3306 domain-containing protein [Boseongicola aestuarii]SMX23601.1 hypothetical protein BOA8489_01711 [Boseongicola aestuarii]
MSGEQNFWSRRKAGVLAEAEAEKAAIEAQSLADEHAVLEEKSDEEILTELNLPEPESLKMGDDFSVFMTRAVPDRLRRRALRVLWRSNPTLANVDMLVDYGEDFTDAALVVENMQTAYQVGKGMLKHIQEMARQAEELENPSEIEPEVEDDDLQELEERELQPEPEEISEEKVLVAESYEPEELIAPSPRRMKFRVEEMS